MPYIRIGDVALVLYCVLSHLGEDYFTTKVYRDQVQKWMVPEAEVMRAALVNTSFLYPPRLYSIQCLMGWDGKRYENGIFMGEDDEQKIPPGMRSYLLTNTLEINGAIAVFIRVLRRKSRRIWAVTFILRSRVFMRHKFMASE